MSKVITYKMPPASIVVGIPFTWGTRNVWAIKVEDDAMYYLATGKSVSTSEEEILHTIEYANSIEIK